MATTTPLTYNPTSDPISGTTQDGQIVKQEFTSGDDIVEFIKINNLNLTYKGYIN
jgi:hypothetical protein